ncbi:MAG: hypothetical protein V3W44_04970 [Dehalococcoidales bacterium]
MFPLWATVIFTIIMLLFTTAILALCLVIWGALLVRLAYTFRYLKAGTGTILAIIFFGSFAWVFGVGAWKISSMVIDGMIARIALLF